MSGVRPFYACEERYLSEMRDLRFDHRVFIKIAMPSRGLYTAGFFWYFTAH